MATTETETRARRFAREHGTDCDTVHAIVRLALECGRLNEGYCNGDPIDGIDGKAACSARWEQYLTERTSELAGLVNPLGFALEFNGLFPTLRRAEQCVEIPYPDQPQAITIIGRRWFQRGPGNTYHSVEIYVDGDSVHRVDYCYGYGNQYAWTARDWMRAHGYLPDMESHGRGPGQSLWGYCDEHGITFCDSVTDVARKRDL